MNYGKTETASDPSENAPPPVFSGITNQTTSNANASTNLETRTFKVDTNVFLANLQKQTGLQTNVSAAMRQLLSRIGVNLSPPKTIFFNDGLGVLFVRATGQDLDTVEKVVVVLTYTPPPQIHIKARFIEVPEDMAKHLGANLISVDLTNVSGVLNGPDLRPVLHNLVQNQGTEELAEPEVITLSGRQTQMRATTTKDITTQYLADSDNSTVVPRYEKVEVGPVLDVIPVVLPDGYTIDLKAIPSLTEFLGYDTPTNSILVATSAGTNVTVPTFLPRFRVRQAVTHLKLWDGQTVVLGSLQDWLVPGGKEVDVKPGSEVHKQLLVFVTITLVDRAGNRIHSDDKIARQQHSAAYPP
jgi:Flp pilus assembly secretin CpaC